MIIGLIIKEIRMDLSEKFSNMRGKILIIKNKDKLL